MKTSPFTGVPGMISLPEQGLLITLAKTVSEKAIIVEIGSEYGMSASILAKYGKGDLYCVEMNPEAQFAANLKQVGLNNFTWLLGKSEDIVKDWDNTISLLWIDGNHQAASVLHDLRKWSEFIPHNGIIALHDYPSATNIKPHERIYAGVKQGVDEWRGTKRGEKFAELYTVDSIIVFIRIEA